MQPKVQHIAPKIARGVQHKGERTGQQTQKRLQKATETAAP
jgi:hypothetical protein